MIQDDDGSSVVAASYAASQDDDLEASSTLEMLDFQKISPEQVQSGALCTRELQSAGIRPQAGNEHGQ